MSNVRINDDGSTIYNGITVETPYEDKTDQGVKVEDFLQLMIAQLTNQDFMNPVDDTQYVTQLAQFATMQSMQEMNQYSQTNYATSLVGKSVTVATLGLGGNVSKDTGLVSSVSLSGDEFLVTVNGKQYKLSQIMNVADPSQVVGKTDLEAANKMSPIVMKTTENGVSVRWEHPVDDKSMQEGLRYDVYITTDDDLDFTTLEGVKKGTKVGSEIEGNEFAITGLEPGTSYRINIVVTAANGNQAIYQSTAAATNEAAKVDEVEG